MNSKYKEPEACRKERIALSKTVTERVVPSKKGYSRRDKHQKDWRD